MARTKAKKKKQPRSESPQATKEMLVQAALELFIEDGLSTPSLDAICERAGFTRGAFYVHFRTRDDLILAVMDRAMGGFIDAIIASGESGADVATIVRTFTFAVRSGAFPFPGRVRTHQLLEACHRSPAVRDKYVELLGKARDRLADTVRRGQEASTVRDDVDPGAIAQLLIALVLGVEIASELGAPHDVDRAAEDVLRMLAK
jgi:TetR/AcrR family transcriptional repressor of nem operon